MKYVSNRFLIAFSFIFFSLFFVSYAQATIYYVATNGSDANNGTSITTPWRTIKKSVESTALKPGDTIYVRGGTYYVDPINYTECWMQTAVGGTTGSPITIKNYNNEDVLVDGRWDIKINGATWQRDSHSGWWYITPGWPDVRAIQIGRAQLWDGNTLIPTTKTGNFSPPTNGAWGMVDVGARKIYYRPLNGTDPNNLPVRFAGCGYFFHFFNNYWTIDGIDTIASGVINYTVFNGAAGVIIQNLNGSYAGDNSCDPGRDGTNGHVINNQGGPTIIRNNELSNSVAEIIHLRDGYAGGDRVENNNVHDASMDPGWGAQCSQGYGREFDTQRSAPGIIARANGSVISNNYFNHNNYEAVRIEKDSTGGSSSNPSNIVVSGNVIMGNTGGGIACSGDLTSNNVDIFNNYLSGNNTIFNWEGQIDLQGSCTNYKIHDNSIVNTLTTPIKLDGNSANVYNNCTSNCGPVPVLSTPSPSPFPSPTPPPTPTPSPATIKGDINKDGIVNSLDWSMMNSKWFMSDANADLNGDGIVNSLDFSLLNSNWLKTS